MAVNIARWTVKPTTAWSGEPAPLRQEFLANVFEALSWFHD